jgi:hypothetical protein
MPRSSLLPYPIKDTDIRHPSFERHGARIYYEEFGKGFPTEPVFDAFCRNLYAPGTTRHASPAE